MAMMTLRTFDMAGRLLCSEPIATVEAANASARLDEMCVSYEILNLRGEWVEGYVWRYDPKTEEGAWVEDISGSVRVVAEKEF